MQAIAPTNTRSMPFPSIRDQHHGPICHCEGQQTSSGYSRFVYQMVFPVPDQKASRIAKLVVEEVIPLFGVPEVLLSDRGTNILSHLVMDLCRMLGIIKLNTTAQCDGGVERFNSTMKTMLRQHCCSFWQSVGCLLPRCFVGVLEYAPHLNRLPPFRRRLSLTNRGSLHFSIRLPYGASRRLQRC